jgi:FkbM family methyltransferase
MNIKKTFRKLLMFLHIDLSKNLQYDRLTRIILRIIISNDFHANAIDVGAHKGEILDLILHYAPKSHHYAFEPLPQLYEELQKKYASKVVIFPYALTEKEGQSTFCMVKNALPYSGLKRRDYKVKDPDIEGITVQTRRLDQVIPIETPISLIKIDVEGGEFDVLRGAEAILDKWEPVLIFKCGKGASNYYDTDPEDFFDFLTIQWGYCIFTLKEFCRKTYNKRRLTREAFAQHFYKGTEYYFVAIVLYDICGVVNGYMKFQRKAFSKEIE